jgi:hypothetical protein
MAGLCRFGRGVVPEQGVIGETIRTCAVATL